MRRQRGWAALLRCARFQGANLDVESTFSWRPLQATNPVYASERVRLLTSAKPMPLGVGFALQVECAGSVCGRRTLLRTRLLTWDQQTFKRFRLRSRNQSSGRNNVRYSAGRQKSTKADRSDNVTTNAGLLFSLLNQTNVRRLTSS